jgi:putative oxidoreductase
MTTYTQTAPMTKARTALLWTLTAFTTGMLLFAGSLKLAGVPMMVQMFGVIGFGQWLRYVTGAIEVIGAALLVVPSLALFGAVPLAATMAAAVLTHVFLIGGNFSMALMLLVATTTIAWLRWSER